MISVGFSRFWFTTLCLFGCLSFGNLVYSQDKPSDKPTQTVIAEGVGSSQDEALKDAFRAAVRQVVGAVIDAETVVKNDEVIDDKVLTYSDGFIKNYEEVADSKKVSGGLHRIKIKAEVERRSVIAKLKAANITVKEVDGKSMFADLVTKEEGESNANEIVRKAISRFPSLLTATVQGKPEYDRDKSELVLKVDVAVDQDAYQQEVKRLEEVLSKIAISKESVVLKAEPALALRDSAGRNSKDTSGTYYSILDQSSLVGPSLTKQKQKLWCLWVCNSASSANSNQRWNCYVLPGNPMESFSHILMPCAQKEPSESNLIDTNLNKPRQLERKNESKTIVSLQFKNDTGNIVIEDEREITMNRDSRGFSRSPLVRLLIERDLQGTRFNEVDFSTFNSTQFVYNGYLAPYILSFQTTYERENWTFATKRTMLFRVKATPEELKSIADVVCNVEYTPDPAMSK